MSQNNIIEDLLGIPIEPVKAKPKIGRPKKAKGPTLEQLAIEAQLEQEKKEQERFEYFMDPLNDFLWTVYG